MDKKLKAVKLYLSGLSTTQVGKRLGISRQRVHQICQEMRVPCRKTGFSIYRTLKLSKYKKKVIRLYLQGKPLKAIADTFNCSIACVRYFLLRNKVKYRGYRVYVILPKHGELMVKMYKNGVSPKKIAKKLKVACSTVYFHLHKLLGPLRNKDLRR